MAKVRVDPAALQQYLDAGHTQADAAKHFGVSEAAISQRVTQARIATSKVVALERAAEVVDQKLTVAQRLQHAEQSSWRSSSGPRRRLRSPALTAQR
jgi:DNA-binding transcriptional regulator YdaS (Cro superfamily)